MSNPIDIGFLERLTHWRNDAQLLLFTLLRLGQGGKIVQPAHSAIFQLPVGTAFSLWRAVFLADQPFRQESALEGAICFLGKVVSDNAIAYAQEKDTRRWTAGLYVGNIQYRMYHLREMYGPTLALKELEHFIKKWTPFREVGAPENQQELIDDAIECVKKLTTRLREIVIE